VISKKHIVILAVVGIGVPLFWGGVSFFFLMLGNRCGQICIGTLST